LPKIDLLHTIGSLFLPVEKPIGTGPMWKRKEWNIAIFTFEERWNVLQLISNKLKNIA
jgi:hypothetical protein